MTVLLSDHLGLGPHELISIVGAGGKTTILHTLGRELAVSGRRVVLTTTTKMASGQITDPVVEGPDPAAIDAALLGGTALFVVAGHEGGKADGLTPHDVDRLFSETSADYVIVEADGARTMSIKAPADHEPVIPSASTMVIVVMGADALGRPISEVAHRPERVVSITGLALDAVLTPEAAGSVICSPDGGLKAVPQRARLVIVVSKASLARSDDVEAFVDLVSVHDRIDRVVTIG